MLNHLWAKIDDLSLKAADVVAQNASASFDISIWQLVAPLLVGARVQLISDELARDPYQLFEETDRSAVTVLETVPTVLSSFLMDRRALLQSDEAPVSTGSTNGRHGETSNGRPAASKDSRAPSLPLTHLRLLISNAEALPVTLCEHWQSLYPRVPLLNTYGATECSDDVTHCRVGVPLERGSAYACLGAPLPNLTVYVLDPQMEPVPCGVAGELYLGGAGTGRGYFNRPELTASRFVPDMFSANPGERLYRTGDLGRRHRDGSLEFVGRADFQVKVRGHRVELEEIEGVLLDNDSVSEAVVLLREDEPGDQRLVAYVVPSRSGRQMLDAREEGAEASAPDEFAATLRSFMSARLPAYMVPGAYVILDALPLTVNGKVDRRALPKPEQLVTASEMFVAPRNEVEMMLCTVWAQLLRVERVGINDNFFALGGHSLLATQVISRVHDVLQIDVPLAAVFRSPTVASFALEVEQARNTRQRTPIVKVDRTAFRSAM
jgi:acyl-coenzyme A synthetase/AMP-(fatty) acid ligase